MLDMAKSSVLCPQLTPNKSTRRAVCKYRHIALVPAPLINLMIPSLRASTN